MALSVANQEKGGTLSWVMGHGSFDTWMRQCCGPVMVPENVGLLARSMRDGAMAG